MTRLALAFGFIVMSTGVAAAQAPPPSIAGPVCVSLDESRDTLAPDDRKAAFVSFQQALAKNHLAVAEGGCATTLTFYNVKLGESITVYVAGPSGTVQGRAAKIDELPLVYDQLARSLVTGQPMGSDQNTDRTNVTTDQMAPRRIAADNLFYVDLGYGAVTGPATIGGTAFGLGWRHELDRLAIELSMNLVVGSSDSSMSTGQLGVSGDFIRLAGYWYQDPIANSSLFYGVGLGWGGASLCENNLSSCYSGGGLAVSPAVGYEMLRSSTIRLIVQANASLPTYLSNSSSTTDRRWTPTINLTIGVGFGRSNTIRIINN